MVTKPQAVIWPFTIHIREGYGSDASYKTASGNLAFHNEQAEKDQGAQSKVTKPQAVIWPFTGSSLVVPNGVSYKTASGNLAFHGR